MFILDYINFFFSLLASVFYWMRSAYIPITEYIHLSFFSIFVIGFLVTYAGYFLSFFSKRRSSHD